MQYAIGNPQEWQRGWRTEMGAGYGRWGLAEFNSYQLPLQYRMYVAFKNLLAATLGP